MEESGSAPRENLFPKRVVRNSKMRENSGQKEFVILLCYQFVFSFPNFFVPNLSITQPEHIQG